VKCSSISKDAHSHYLASILTAKKAGAMSTLLPFHLVILHSVIFGENTLRELLVTHPFLQCCHLCLPKVSDPAVLGLALAAGRVEGRCFELGQMQITAATRMPY
jgi:hypothetical protein